MTRIAHWPLVLLFAACSSAPHRSAGLQRCIWVDRWDYQTAADIERIMTDCRDAGFSAVMFQVRGNGTVAYRSSLEVWSERFGFKDPGFDPLRSAVTAAHARGLQLHAWLNLMPGWVGTEAPKDPRQLKSARPDWFLHNRDGHGQAPKAGKYLALNPCLPEVRTYLANLVQEVASNYDVDGLHIDYVRFPDPEGDDVDALGTDSRTLGLFTAATGKPVTDAAALQQWQTSCVTQLVQQIAAVVRPTGKQLTAAVFADPEVARQKVRQDWSSWLQRRLVDAVTPMNYTADDAQFAARVRADVALAHGMPVITAVGSYQHDDPAQTVRQLDAALQNGSSGVGVFNYRTLFGTPAKTGPTPAARRAAVSGWLAGKRR